MMSKLAMSYGSSGMVAKSASNLAASGLIDDNSTVDIILDVGGLYMLYTAEFNATSGAYRGVHMRIIKAPEEQYYGTTAASTASIHASTNSGLSFTANNDSTISIAPNSATYAVRYALYKLV